MALTLGKKDLTEVQPCLCEFQSSLAIERAASSETLLAAIIPMRKGTVLDLPNSIVLDSRKYYIYPIKRFIMN